MQKDCTNIVYIFYVIDYNQFYLHFRTQKCISKKELKLDFTDLTFKPYFIVIKLAKIKVYGGICKCVVHDYFKKLTFRFFFY